MTIFSFSAPTRLVWGGVTEEVLHEHIVTAGWKSIGVLVDARLAQQLPVAGLVAGLRESTPRCVVVCQEQTEPDTEYADSTAEAFRSSRVDALIGIGGGSVLDLTKAVAGLVTNPGRAADYQGFNLLPGPGLPTVAVPTTAGTGSEVTWTAVLTNRERSLKLGINSPHLFPQLAVLDPRLTVTMPRAVTVATGLDALGHAIESFTAVMASPVSRALSKTAAELMFSGLTAVLRAEDDLPARARTQLGAAVAGYAILNAGTGAAHAMAYPLGVHFRIPHGEAIAMLLPLVMEHNECKWPGLYTELAESLGPGRPGEADRLTSSTVVATVAALARGAGRALRLKDWGVSASDLPMLAARSMDLRSAAHNNPVEFTERDAFAVLEALL